MGLSTILGGLFSGKNIGSFFSSGINSLITGGISSLFGSGEREWRSREAEKQRQWQEQMMYKQNDFYEKRLSQHYLLDGLTFLSE